MAELQVDEQAAPSCDVQTPRELTLVREACAFLANANSDVACSLSIVIPAPNSGSSLAAVAERIAEEYGLRGCARRKGEVLILDIGRTVETPLRQ